MKNIIVCIFLNLKRCRNNMMGTVITMICLPVFIIGFSFVSKDNHIGKIAIYNGNNNIFEYLNEKNIIYEKVELKDLKQRKLEKSGEYLGYISYDISGNVSDYGSYIKKGKIIEQIVNKTYILNNNKFNFLQNIFPALISIIFLESILNMKLYLEDINSGVLKRLKILGIKNQEYCLATLLYGLLFMFIPIFISFITVRYGLKIDFEYSFFKVIILLSVTIILSNLCAFLLCSIISNGDFAIMVGNILVIITSIISGIFGEWDKLIKLGNIMPQRILLNLMNSFLDNNLLNINFCLVLIYIFISYFLILFFNNKKFEGK